MLGHETAGWVEALGTGATRDGEARGSTFAFETPAAFRALEDGTLEGRAVMVPGTAIRSEPGGGLMDDETPLPAPRGSRPGR